MKTNILFIGSFATSDLVLRFPSWGLDTYKVSEFLIEGFRANNDLKVDVVTSPDLPLSWPRFPLLYLKGHYDKAFNVRVVSSLNVSYISLLWTIITMVLEAMKIISKNNEGNTNVIIPYMVFRHVVTAWLLKKLFPKKVNVIIIIGDIFFPLTIMGKILNRLAEKLTKTFDAYVLYTKAMASYLEIEDKHHMIMEGVIDLNSFPVIEKKSNLNTVVLYTGRLHNDHDVMKLFEVMRQIERQDVELWISGWGDLYNDIKIESEKDKRIKFWGTVDKDKVFELQAQADILINPRSDIGHEDITKYMFPSKVLEYMYSGNPAIVCKMSGIPEEYFQYLVVPKDNSVESIVESLEEVIDWPRERKKEFGKKAKEFVTQKNAHVQSNRIKLLIDSLQN